MSLDYSHSRTHCRDHHWRPVPGCPHYCRGVTFLHPSAEHRIPARPAPSPRNVRALWTAALWLWSLALAVAFSTPPLSGGTLLGVVLVIAGGLCAALAIIRKDHR